MRKTLIACIVVAALVACGKKEETTVASTEGTTSATTTSAAPAASTAGSAMSTMPAAAVPAAVPAAPPSQGKLTGKVAEAFNAAGYTYLRLQTANGEEWAAIPEAPVRKGETVALNIQMTAEKFESKTLKRRFDKIYFANIDGGGPAPASPGSIAMSTQGMPPNHPPIGSMPPAAVAAMGSAAQHMQAPEAGDVNVPKAEGGKTIGELWSAKDALKEKDVVVRGKVVKFLAGIMGKNWIHLRDGSGSKAAGTDDITVTTNDTAAVGDIVTVRGKLTVDKDFGAGYRYPVIIEEAKVSK